LIAFSIAFILKREFYHQFLARQALLNAALDLDKNETQVAPAADDKIEPPGDVLQGRANPPSIQRNSALGMSP
jgi:hypothetical protein